MAKGSSARQARRSDGAALLLRLAVGPMLFTHGYNKVFGPGGLHGATRWFDALGFKPANVHARLAAAVELGAGSLLTVGAASPLPAAAAIGVMTTATLTDHKGKGFFVFKGGWEYTALVAVVASAIATLGPGRYSWDALRRRQRSGLRWGLLAAALGVGGSAAVLATSYHPEAPGSPPAAGTPAGAED